MDWAEPNLAIGDSWSIINLEPSNARERILKAAARLFSEHGFNTTGIDAVVTAAGVAKATLYKHFSSKMDLIADFLAVESHVWRQQFFRRLDESGLDTHSRLLTIFDVLEEWFAQPDFRGCPFINASVEFTQQHERICSQIAAHKDHIAHHLTEALTDLGVADVNASVRCFMILIDGAIVTAHSSGDPTFARNARLLAQQNLEASRRGV